EQGVQIFGLADIGAVADPLSACFQQEAISRERTRVFPPERSAQVGEVRSGPWSNACRAERNRFSWLERHPLVWQTEQLRKTVTGFEHAPDRLDFLRGHVDGKLSLSFLQAKALHEHE